MSDWVIRCSELLTPLVDELKTTLLSQPVIHADETPLKLSKPIELVATCGSIVVVAKREKTTTWKILFYMIITTHEPPLVWLTILMAMLHMEKTEAILAGCMAHARRKFIDAKTVQEKTKQAKLMLL